MTEPIRISPYSPEWWVLSSISTYGIMTAKELVEMGTHEVPAAIGRIKALLMVETDTGGYIHLTPKGRRALRVADNERKKSGATSIAGVRSHCSNSLRATYDATELAPFDGRPGAMDAYSLPSLQGNARVYRDGRREVA